MKNSISPSLLPNVGLLALIGDSMPLLVEGIKGDLLVLAEKDILYLILANSSSI